MKFYEADIIQELAPNLPVVFTGDLNVTPETEAISTIKSFLTDSKDQCYFPDHLPVFAKLFF